MSWSEYGQSPNGDRTVKEALEANQENNKKMAKVLEQHLKEGQFSIQSFAHGGQSGVVIRICVVRMMTKEYPWVEQLTYRFPRF